MQVESSCEYRLYASKTLQIISLISTPYHLPLFLASKLGYFTEEGIKVAILEPNNPSDVTEIIGSGRVDLELKAIIHTIAGKARDKPFTRVIHLSHKSQSIGYIGEFKKIQLDDLTSHFGMTPKDDVSVRVGMNCEIDAGIGIENIQQVELEEWSVEQGRSRDDVKMLSIDELAELECCCFCSILYIGNEEFIQNNPDKIEKYLCAIKRATYDMISGSSIAYSRYAETKPHLDTDIERIWNKVTDNCKRLSIVDTGFKQNQTNEFLTWSLLPEGPGGVDLPTVETGVVKGGCKGCQYPSIAQPEIVD
ncbi:NMT1/THI5 like-domain-containing protein [Pilaira anomala]|nr:NMT1/THI5 like-domain-containing protein [Pilaira anomala]